MGPRLTPYTHPHLQLEETMTSVPKVNPGDMVFWHCDVVHSVEREHTGLEDSAGSFCSFLPLSMVRLSADGCSDVHPCGASHTTQ